jgi:hypothetical protein
VKDVK